MEKDTRSEPFTPQTICSGHDAEAVRELMSRIGDKWSIFLIVALSKLPEGRGRFSEIERVVPGISQRMLTTTLKALVHDGFVTREVFAEVPPRVEYELTELGESLLVPMQALVDWVGEHWKLVEQNRLR